MGKRGPKATPLDVRYEQFVVRGSGCWDWIGVLDSKGYPVLFITRGIKVYAHRLSWELTNGSIPKGFCIYRTCANRLCSNPEHLAMEKNHDMLRLVTPRCRGVPKRRKEILKPIWEEPKQPDNLILPLGAS